MSVKKKYFLCDYGLMGNAQFTHLNFQDMQELIKTPQRVLIINTLPDHEQNCLICNTLPFHSEVAKINQCLTQRQSQNMTLVVYGKNYADPTVSAKVKQLLSLGFPQVYVYAGGLFEWLMMQDIFGIEEFPTTKKELNFIQYRPPSGL
jgi:hypothetical protein